MAHTAAHLVEHVIPRVPARQWVLSLPIPLRVLLAAQPQLLTPVLQVVHRVLSGFLLGQVGLKPGQQADSGAVTLIQRFGSAANLNIYLHCLVLDGVYRRTDAHPVFVEACAPTDEDLQGVLHKIIGRILKLLVHRGVLAEEQGVTYLAERDGDGDDARALTGLQAAACTYRTAWSPGAGQKVASLQGRPAASGAAQPTAVRQRPGLQPARRSALRLRRAAGARTTMSVHHAPGTGQRARALQPRRPSGAEAQDRLARRHHPPCPVAAAVHAAAGRAGAAPAFALDPIPWGARAQCQAARAGDSGRAGP